MFCAEHSCHLLLVKRSHTSERMRHTFHDYTQTARWLLLPLGRLGHQKLERFRTNLNVHPGSAQCSLPNPTFQARRPLPESPQRNETPWSSSTAWGGGTKDPSFKSHWGLSIKGKGGLLKEVVGRSCVPFPLLTGRIFYCCYCLVPIRVGGVPCSSNHAEALVGNWRPRLSQHATVPRITGLPVYAANRVIVFTHSLTGTKCHGGILPDSSGHPWLMFLHCGWFERIKTGILEQQGRASPPNGPWRGLIL